METVYYTLYTCAQEKASGGEERRCMLLRRDAPQVRDPKEGCAVISLEEYRTQLAQNAANAAAPEEERPVLRLLPGSTPGEGEKPRRSNALLCALELAVCGALIAVAAAACAVFLG